MCDSYDASLDPKALYCYFEFSSMKLKKRLRQEVLLRETPYQAFFQVS